MPKPTLEEILNIPDPMLNDNFELVFAMIPGGGDNRRLRVQCKSTSKPGMSLQQAEMELFGHKVLHVGRKTFSHSMSISFHESYDAYINRTLERWSERGRSTDRQSGTFKRDYCTTAELSIFDQTGALAQKWNIYNIWPTEVPEAQFEGSGGTAMTTDATFAYDYYKPA